TTGIAAAAVFSAALCAQTPDQVLVVVNRRSADSLEIGRYYMQKRTIPKGNLCTIDTAPVEGVQRPVYEKEVEAPIAAFLKAHGLREKILYIVLTAGVPLKMWGDSSQPLHSPGSSVDSELTLLYQRMAGRTIPLEGPYPNPFFQQRDAPFRHPLFPIYLVTRLQAYDVAEAKGLVDKSLAARDAGEVVIDLRADNETPGNDWLRAAALLVPKDRLIMDSSATVVTNIKNVIAYASWGSNDHDRKHRFVNFQWLPGAIATEFVSTNARTFKRPPDTWEIGPWSDRKAWFEGGPQTLTADYVHEGASGVSGQVDEPYLGFCPRPEFIIPAYLSGHTLAESFYMGIPGLSWMNVVVGDPLMRLPQK
ncbi:MAG: TIGR03790 family protein, partial [Acidobacteriota bacterium]|nr:TIGR03790 family protein [Acidobacteriota bacterium]